MGERRLPLDVSALGITLEGVRYAPAQRRIVVDAPMNVSLAYIAIYSGRAFDYFGVPAPSLLPCLNVARPRPSQSRAPSATLTPLCRLTSYARRTSTNLP
ncbi:MAG: hypothetical protein TU35_004440 [Thermoproteus sp. AZ2]|uniref:Uncharacterized protein n=1 Tax=Thermoproteus sp. AZ2 TaxID=1609232 RepID=A0ACC6V0N5_9CREN